MFFAPTILALISLYHNEETHQDGQIYSLCLSSGDADGLGELRKKELRDSLDVLGIPQERTWVLDEPCVTFFTFLIQIPRTQATQVQG